MAAPNSGRTPVRVLFVVPSMGVGGGERVVSTLLPALSKTRCEPFLVCIGDEGQFFEPLVEAGINAQAMHLHGRRNTVRALRELIRITRSIRPDVVVAFSYSAEVIGRIAARFSGVEHEIVWVHHYRHMKPRSSIREIVDRALNRRTSVFLGVADAQRTFMLEELRYPADRIRLINNGIDSATIDCTDDRSTLAEFGIDESDPIVGIVARLEPVKNHPRLLRAARMVLRDFPKAKFLIIGDGPFRAELEQLSRDLGIERSVYFLGTRLDVMRLLRATDVIALTSDAESMPMAVLEAMACARPVVCTAVGGISEIVAEDCGFLVAPEDPDQLAPRIVELLRNPALARRMGRAGRDRVQSEFSLDRSVAEFESMIEDVVLGGGECTPAEKDSV